MRTLRVSSRHISISYIAIKRIGTEEESATNNARLNSALFLFEFNHRYSQGRFQSNIARAPNHERVIAVKGDSLLSLSKLVAAGGASKFDVIYVDGGHEVCC